MAKTGGKRHPGEQIVGKLRDGAAMLAAGKNLAHMPQAFGIAESTWQRWQKQCGGMRSDEAKRLAALERENAQPKRAVADQPNGTRRRWLPASAAYRCARLRAATPLGEKSGNPPATLDNATSTKRSHGLRQGNVVAATPPRRTSNG